MINEQGQGLVFLIGTQLSFPDEININRKQRGNKKGPGSHGIDKRIANIPPADLIGVIPDKRTGQVSFAKSFLNMPLPVSYRAIANPKPDTKYKPAGSGDGNTNKMGLPRSLPYPAKEVKANYGEMKQG